MLDDPIGQGTFKANVAPGLFRFNPFMPQDFIPLRLEFAVEGGIPQQIARRHGVFGGIGHSEHVVNAWESYTKSKDADHNIFVRASLLDTARPLFTKCLPLARGIGAARNPAFPRETGRDFCEQ
jgi:hypothetical protein